MEAFYADNRAHVQNAERLAAAIVSVSAPESGPAAEACSPASGDLPGPVHGVAGASADSNPAAGVAAGLSATVFNAKAQRGGGGGRGGGAGAGGGGGGGAAARVPEAEACEDVADSVGTGKQPSRARRPGKPRNHAGDSDQSDTDQENESSDAAYWERVLAKYKPGHVVALFAGTTKLGTATCKSLVRDDHPVLKKSGTVVTVGYMQVVKLAVSSEANGAWDFTNGDSTFVVGSDGKTGYSTLKSAVAARCETYYVYGQLIKPS